MCAEFMHRRYNQFDDIIINKFVRVFFCEFPVMPNAVSSSTAR